LGRVTSWREDLGKDPGAGQVVVLARGMCAFALALNFASLALAPDHLDHARQVACATALTAFSPEEAVYSMGIPNPLAVEALRPVNEALHPFVFA
jgi:hypothetical protein